MKVLSWNIRHGGGSRISRICDALIAHDPDVILLNEFRTRPGRPMVWALGRAGWVHCEHTSPLGTDNGVCALSRTPLLRRSSSPAPSENAVRWLDIDLPHFGFSIGAIHILTATPGIGDARGRAKARFWDAVVQAAAERLDEPFVFIGDLNTGLRRIDEPGSTFLCAEHFARLTELGWTDAWRHFNGSGFEPTWISTAGNGFRLDHAFVSAQLLPRVRACCYSHAERDAGISDHSMLVLEIEA